MIDAESKRHCHDISEGIGPGTFVAIVGPSGAGKDTLIGAVRFELRSDERFHFVRRMVTRTAIAGDEDHDTIETAAFDLMMAEQRCALAWRAHGNAYVLPLSTDEAVAAGRVVVANLSRTVLDEARQRYRSCVVVEVTAPADVLRQRLASRGRESSEDIDRRVSRAHAVPIEGADVIKLDNGGALAVAQSRFMEILLQIAEHTSVDR